MIQHYRTMADDPVRLAIFQRAIAEAVRPGDTVVDIGCGLGTFTVFACQAGAGRVYAVEDAPILEIAEEVIRKNGYADRVRFLGGISTRIEAPERARVVIFEDYITTLLSPALVRTVQDLVARWLEPGGALLPSQARVWLAPVEDAQGYHGIDRFSFTHDRVFGVDLGPTRRRVFSSVHQRTLPPAALMAQPSLARAYDLSRLDGAGFSFASEVRAERDGTLHGLLSWFELEVGPSWLGTGPLSPPSAWQQNLFPFEQPLSVHVGASIALSLEAAPFGDSLIWRWSAQAEGAQASANSLEGTPLRADLLAQGRAEHVPPRRLELEVDAFLLGAIDGRLTVRELAERLKARFPERFPTADEAERRLAASLARYP